MSIAKSLIIAIAVLFPFLKGYASGLKDSASIGVNTYNDNADVNVYSPTFSLMKTLSKNFLVGFKMRVDAITAASIKNGGNPVRVDAVVGASAKEGFDEVRYAPTLLMAYDDGDNALSGGVYYSTENDYDGKAIFLNYTRQLNEQNTAIGIGFSQSDDRWKPVFNRDLPKDYRREGKVDLFINQLISPESSIQFVYSYMNSSGFLSSPYHYVVQDSFARFENYPDTRKGYAIAARGVTMLNDTNSVNFGYRYYKDDWDISSHTINAEVWHDFSYLFSASLRGRYYTQTKANFAKEVGGYNVTDTYFAVDYRMSAFDSYDVGTGFIYRPSLSSMWKYRGSIDLYQTSRNDYIKNWYDTDSIMAVYTTFNIEYEF